MKVKFHAETNWPVDKKVDPVLSGVEWEIWVDFPMIPRVGDMVKVHADDDYREVESVYLDPFGKEADVEVFLKFSDEPCYEASMKAMGWRES